MVHMQRSLTQQEHSTARHKAPFPDLPGSPGEGEAELGGACPFVLICPRACTELPAPGCLSEGVSNATTHTWHCQHGVQLHSESHGSSTGRQDTPEPNQAPSISSATRRMLSTLRALSGKDAHTPQHIAQNKLWLTTSAAPSQGLDKLFPWRTGKPKSLSTALKTAGQSFAQTSELCLQAACFQKPENHQSRELKVIKLPAASAIPQGFTWSMRHHKSVNSFHTAMVLENAL